MRCAVLGSPIEHSLSPAVHRAAYAELGIDWTYDAIEVREDELAAFVAGLGHEWRGLSLTMPLKRAVQPLLTTRDELVQLTGIANTVIFDGGERRGLNTDIPGAIAALRERAGSDFSASTAIVLGGGATAASMIWALTDLGLESAVLVVRDPQRAVETLDAVAAHPAPAAIEVATFDALGSRAADIVVSTIPAEAQVGLTPSAPVIFDVVYDPWPTPLSASGVGSAVVSGLDLLVHQAVLQVEAMTGQVAPLAAMRAAGEAELARRS